MKTIQEQVSEAFAYLFSQSALKPGSLVVLGCSTSEVGGSRIGKAGSPDLGQTIASAALDACQRAGVHLAVQCCEHLNRALVISKDVAEARGYASVFAVPHPTAGGSCGSAAYRLLGEDATVVETISAEAGVDIGDTFIGMHLRPVAVPVRPPFQTIGLAHLTMAYTRPKYIGGPRAQYSL